MFKRLKINGKPVKDAKKDLQVIITPADVKKGALKDATSCAAARALMRQTGCEQARVHTNRTYVKKGEQWFRYATPPALRAEIIAFDRGGTFEPGEYHLKPVTPSQRSGARKTRANNTDMQGTPGKPKKKRARHMTTGIRERLNVAGKIV